MSWRLIFAINLPIAVAVVLVARRYIPESRDPGEVGRVDLLGGALVTLGLVGLTYGLINGSAAGWSRTATLTALVLGGGLLAVFTAWERRAATPILPMHLFTSTRFSATNLVTFIVYGALGGALFLLPLELQQVAGHTPLAAGVSLLPITALMLLLSARSGALAARIGPRLQMSAGPVLVGLGLGLFVWIGPSGDYLTQVLPAVTALGLGLAVTVAPLTATVLSAVPPQHAGVASAVNNDVARAAGLIAVAVLPAAAGITEAAYHNPTQFLTGFHSAAVICAVLCVLAGALAAATIRNGRGAPASPSGRPTTTGDSLVH